MAKPEAKTSVPGLFAKTSIKSLELEYGVLRSATWSGVADDGWYILNAQLP